MPNSAYSSHRETPPGPRGAMLATLADDLTYSNWDATPQLWTIHTDNHGEYLSRVGELKQPLDTWLNNHLDNRFAASVIGLCIAQYGKTYTSDTLDRAIQHDPNGHVLAAYSALLPPRMHSKKQDSLAVLAAWRDGDAAQCLRFSDRNQPPYWTVLRRPIRHGRVHHHVHIDAMRVMLGLCDTEPIDFRNTVAGLVQTASAEGWPADRLAVALYEMAPQEARDEMLAGFSENIRQAVLDAQGGAA